VLWLAISPVRREGREKHHCRMNKCIRRKSKSCRAKDTPLLFHPRHEGRILFKHHYPLKKRPPLSTAPPKQTKIVSLLPLLILPPKISDQVPLLTISSSTADFLVTDTDSKRKADHSNFLALFLPSPIPNCDVRLHLCVSVSSLSSPRIGVIDCRDMVNHV
jgi:hypothetical protein